MGASLTESMSKEAFKGLQKRWQRLADVQCSMLSSLIFSQDFLGFFLSQPLPLFSAAS